MAISRLEQFVSLDIKGCICHFVNWQIHPFIFKMTLFWQLHMWNIHNPGFLNPLTAKLFNRTFHPLEVVSRWRDPQLQVSKNYSDLTKWRLTILKSCWLISHFISNMFKRWYVKCKKEKPNIFVTGGWRVKLFHIIFCSHYAYTALVECWSNVWDAGYHRRCLILIRPLHWRDGFRRSAISCIINIQFFIMFICCCKEVSVFSFIIPVKTIFLTMPNQNNHDIVYRPLGVRRCQTATLQSCSLAHLTQGDDIDAIPWTIHHTRDRRVCEVLRGDGGILDKLYAVYKFPVAVN